MGRRKKQKRQEDKVEEQERRKEKGIKKHKKKKKSKKDEKEEDVKEEQAEEVRSKRKNKKSKSKKKAKQHESQVKEQLSVEQTFEQHKIPNKKHKKKQQSQPYHEPQSHQMTIDLQSIKFQQDFPSSPQPPLLKKQLVSFQDSQRIIYIFSLDAGDYKGLRSELPHIPQKNIRNHLTSIFQSCIDKITDRVKHSGRKIKQWQQHQRREIIRQLHRIRSSNRLLSEINVQFRETFHKMMRTYNHPDIIVTQSEITFLFRKIQAFVRGFNQLAVFRKNHYVPPDQQDQTRKPIFQGGYIMEQRSKMGSQRGSEGRLNPNRLILEWQQEQEVEICKLYLANPNYQFIIENLRARFGESAKWKDFQIVSKKLDQLIKAGLNRLDELTAKPYNRNERMLEEERREKWKQEERKRLKLQKVSRRFGDFIEFREGRVIKNPSLLLKQVFAHSGESYKVKYDLINLLVERYPEESQLQSTLQIIKNFTEWADREEQTNHVTMVRARLPVIDDGTRPKSMKGNDENGSQRGKEDNDLVVGLNLLEDLNEEPLPKQQAPSPKVQFTQQKSPKTVVVDVDQVKKQEIIEVFQSQESEYQGFLSHPVKSRL